MTLLLIDIKISNDFFVNTIIKVVTTFFVCTILKVSTFFNTI